MSRHLVAQLSELPQERGHEVVVEGQIIGLYRSGDSVRALDGICPHSGGPLSTGYVSGDLVTCPWHGWQFHLDTGCHKMTPNVTQKTYQIDVDGNDVFVILDD